MAEIRMWVGAAGFTLGLSLAGLCAAGVAAADSDSTDSTAADSPRSQAGPQRSAATVKSRPARSAATAVKTAAATSGAKAKPAPARAQRKPATPPVRAALTAPVADATAVPVLDTAATAPSITIHNASTTQPIWVYNLTDTGHYAIPATPWSPPVPPPPASPPDWLGPVQIAAGSSAPVTLTAFNAPAGSPGNRIYIVEGAPFTLPITDPSGIDPFNPTATPGTDSFQNCSFLEYSLYPAAGGGYQYTIDISYIDEWSLPLQTKFTLNGAAWAGAVDGTTYGFADFDTVVSQLNAAGGPWGQLVWSGATPWDPQPPATVRRIIGPDKVWAVQSGQLPPNFTLGASGWVPASYQNFVKYGSYLDTNGTTVYPYSFSGTQLSSPPVPPNPQSTTAQSNFDFWRYRITAPGSTPYPIALRTAAIHDGFPGAGGVYGFFTYPNDEAAGQFTNIPTAVSLDIYVHGSSDGASASVIPGGVWEYTSSFEPKRHWWQRPPAQPVLSGTEATDTFILDTGFRTPRWAPQIDVTGVGGDIAVIDRAALRATSTAIDVVDRAWFLCRGFAQSPSQFVYERSTGTLYYDRFPHLPGYTAVLGRFGDLADPTEALYVL